MCILHKPMNKIQTDLCILCPYRLFLGKSQFFVRILKYEVYICLVFPPYFVRWGIGLPKNGLCGGIQKSLENGEGCQKGKFIKVGVKKEKDYLMEIYIKISYKQDVTIFPNFEKIFKH